MWAQWEYAMAEVSQDGRVRESTHAEVDADAAPMARETEPKPQTCWEVYMCFTLQ
jgi:hypothetical protein